MTLFEHAHDHKIKKSCLKSYFSYDLVVALACLVANFLTLGFTYGSLSILPLYYQEHYGTRELSTNIGTVQLAICLLGGKQFPLYASVVQAIFYYALPFFSYVCQSRADL